jgi:hypothetical protein
VIDLQELEAPIEAADTVSAEGLESADSQPGRTICNLSHRRDPLLKKATMGVWYNGFRRQSSQIFLDRPHTARRGIPNEREKLDGRVRY